MPFLLIDKPAGITSHDVIDRVRKVTGEKRVGHAGTLDPFATGLLIVAVGRESTRELSQFLHADKEYVAEIRLGETTETLDPEGAVESKLPRANGQNEVRRDELEAAITELTGTISQIPPMYSALKKGGKKMYELARAGKTVEIAPREVTVKVFEVVGALPEVLALPVTIPARIEVSSGTYIRAIARDLGDKLGTGGYLTGLRRTIIGPWTLEKATSLDGLTPENWRMLAIDLPASS